MTEIRSPKSKWLRGTLAVALAVLLAVGVYLVWPSRGGQKVVAYFPTAVGLYPGDDVRIVGVPVGRIDAIQPRAQDVKISMTLDDGIRLPSNAQAIIIAPNLVSARFIQLTPAYTEGDVLADGAEIGLDRTGVPVEWDEVKEQLTALSTQLGPQEGGLQGPLTQVVNQAADGALRRVVDVVEVGQTVRRDVQDLLDVIAVVGEDLGELGELAHRRDQRCVGLAEQTADIPKGLIQRAEGGVEILGALGEHLRYRGHVVGELHDLLVAVGQRVDENLQIADGAEQIGA